ncbi:MAG: hypothetical protein IKJ80_07315 [Clostridia bacterium]|nr:hypothetical protein [Clostridia bacterium]
MKTKRINSIISLLMSLCLLLNAVLLPVGISASAESSDAGASGSAEPTIVYSEDTGVGFEASAPVYRENGGRRELVLSRAGEVSAPQTVTLKIYDNSAEYGVDYVIKKDGVTIEKRAGATSIFNAFRDGGVLTSNLPIDAAEAYVAYSNSAPSDATASAKASDMLTQMEELGALAAELEISFAAGESRAVLTIEPLDDEISEYSESFMLILLGRDKNVIEDSQILCSIEDNESAPSVHIEFESTASIEASKETGVAQVTFKRNGNLATGTSALLLRNEAPVGYVNFAPFQNTQVVLALPGTYRLVSDGNYTVNSDSLKVLGEAKEFSTLPEGADPTLDALPGEYSSMPQMIQGVPSISKFAKWVSEGAKETDEYIVIMGSKDNGLFEKDNSSTDGSVKFHSDNNIYCLNTEGGASKGYLFLRTSSRYSLSGISSIDGSVYVDDLDTGYCDVIFGIWDKEHRKIYTNDNKSTQNLSQDVAIGMGSQYIYYCNSDLKGAWDCGWSAYVPNGFKMNKRPYDIHIMNPEALSYGEASFAPTISNNVISGITMGADKKINISYTCDSAHPARLVGYQLFNGTNYSDTISLSDSSITFDQAFLDKYEAKWGYKSVNADGEAVRVFSIVPVFGKIPVEVELLNSNQGKLEITSPDTDSFGKGDVLVFSGTANDGRYFNGVHCQIRQSAGSEIESSMTFEPIDVQQDGKWTKVVKVPLLSNYLHYTFQGIFTEYKDELIVKYADAAPNGKLNFEPGVVLGESDYRVSDYFPLTATPNEGYITVWDANGNYYFGDIFNYQLDGNFLNYSIFAKFLKDGELLVPNDQNSKITLSSGKISGKLTRKDVNLFDGTQTQIPLSNTMYTVTTSHGTYNGFTDENGNFSIDGFTGVLGGTYSMAVNYQDRVGYVNFKYNGAGDSYNLSLPQFAVGGFYPNKVTATVSGQGYNSNSIILTSSGTVEIAASIFVYSNQYKITNVKFHFLSTLNSNYGDELKVLDAVQSTNNKLGDNYQLWMLNLSDTSAIPENTRMYISVTAEYTYDSGATVIMTTDLVNSGYNVVQALNEDVVPIPQDIPEIPGVQSGNDDTGIFDIPVIGTLDMSFSSKTGGYFVQQGSWKQAGDVYTLVCGHSIQPNYMSGTLKSKYEGAVATRDMLDSASSGDPKGAAALKQKSAAQFEIAPIFMFKFTVETADDGSGGLVHNITGIEFAIGLDAFVCKNVPFNISGVACYICVTLSAEAYFQMQLALAESKALGSQLDTVITDLNEEAEKNVNAFFAAPIISFGLKGGVGWNGWASIFAEGTVTAPFIIGFTPVDAAGSIAFDIGIGADMMMFTAKLSYKTPKFEYGSESLITDLKTIQQYKNPTPAAYMLSSGESYDSFEEAINNASFTMMARPEKCENILQSGGITQSTLAKGVFKNTNIQLIKLNNGNVMALFLTDNHAPDGSFNYLSAAYSISSDNGQTWSEVEYIDKNIGTASSSLQYDINVYELQDRILVTWSEADLDTLLQDMDPDNLKAAQIAKLVNAMNLNGRFFDIASGAPIGDAFVIAENSAVFCGALEAVQNGENVYVYYQRNALSTTENVTVESLMKTERTIAMASASINDTSNWVSTPVHAMDGEGGQYRITEVEPFVHDGILGEIIVIDRNGRLLSYDSASGEMIPDINDRQLYLRTYSFGEDGAPATTSFVALSDATDCAQNPEVVSNEDYLYLFWNHNGEIVYAPDFVATDSDDELTRSKAVVIADAAGKHSVKSTSKFAPVSIDGDESLHVGSTFTVSMSEGGKVLICWVGNDTEKTEALVGDQVYGIMLETKLVADVTRDVKNADGGEAEREHQLWAVGSPVAITAESNPIGALDSLCLDGEETKFILAYTRFNNELRNNSTGADIIAITKVYNPELSVSVDFPEYPMPGENATARVKVRNGGFCSLNGYTLTLTGIGADITISSTDTLLPGRYAELSVEVAVPADFSADAELTVTVSGVGEQSKHGATAKTSVLYGSYFVPTDLPEIHAIPNSDDCTITVFVKNIGNAAGSPELEYLNRIYASDSEDDEVSAKYSASVVITPNGEAAITYTLQDSLIGREDYSTVVVRLGDKYDQSTEAPMPKAQTLSISDLLNTLPVSGEDAPVDSETTPSDTTPVDDGGCSKTSFAIIIAVAVVIAAAACIVPIIVKKKRNVK